MKKQTKKQYTTEGSVRGECGHVHRTVKAAEKCIERDQRGCKSQGGYSDRHVVVIGGGLADEYCDGCGPYREDAYAVCTICGGSPLR